MFYILLIVRTTYCACSRKREGGDKNGGGSSHDGGDSGGSDGYVAGTVDMSGLWTRKRSDNIEAFLGANGAGFAQRKLGAKMTLVHTITMNPQHGLTAMRLQEDGGPIHLDNTYTVSRQYYVTVSALIFHFLLLLLLLSHCRFVYFCFTHDIIARCRV